MATRILCWTFVCAIGFSSIIITKTIILAPEEIISNPELTFCLFMGIVAMIFQTKQLWPKHIKKNYSPIAPLSESPAREPEIVDLLSPHYPNSELGE